MGVNPTGDGKAAGENQRCYKLVMLGDASVGKTHFFSRFCNNTLPKSPQATVGLEFGKVSVTLEDGTTIRAHLWDTAGQERYRSVTANHFRRAEGALLLYDLTKRDSFVNVVRWLEELKQNGEPDMVIMLVGNKKDLVDNDSTARAVTREEGETFARKQGLRFIEASALTGENVKPAYEQVLAAVYRQDLAAEAKGSKGNDVSRGFALTPVGGGFSEEYNRKAGGGMTFGDAPAAEESGCC